MYILNHSSFICYISISSMCFNGCNFNYYFNSHQN